MFPPVYIRHSLIDKTKERKKSSFKKNKKESKEKPKKEKKNSKNLYWAQQDKTESISIPS